ACAPGRASSSRCRRCRGTGPSALAGDRTEHLRSLDSAVPGNADGTHPETADDTRGRVMIATPADDGRAPDLSERVLVALDRATCLRLLGTAAVGRLV